MWKLLNHPTVLIGTLIAMLVALIFVLGTWG